MAEEKKECLCPLCATHKKTIRVRPDYEKMVGEVCGFGGESVKAVFDAMKGDIDQAYEFMHHFVDMALTMIDDLECEVHLLKCPHCGKRRVDEVKDR